jgi:hypothetical protein
VRYTIEMAEVPKEKRSEVEALIKKTPGLRSPALALRFLKGDEHGTLAQENERLRKELDEAKKPRPRVEQRMTGSAKAIADRKEGGALSITVAEYAKEMESPEGRAKLNAARREGKLVLRAK